MEIKLLDQIGGFGAFCLFGAVLGVYHTAYKLLRYFAHFSRWAIFWQDILFFATSAIATFAVLMNITEGEVRGYILLGVVIGFAAYYFTLGALIFAVGKFIIDIAQKVYEFLNRRIILPIKKFLRRILRKIAGLLKKWRQKSSAFLKKKRCRTKKSVKKSNMA